MASTIASTLALSRPSEKLGTHSTRVDIRGKEYHLAQSAKRDASSVGRTLLSAAFDFDFVFVASDSVSGNCHVSKPKKQLQRRWTRVSAPTRATITVWAQ